MRKIFIILLFALFAINTYSTEISDSLQVSVLTVSPGDELYSTFGHVGIRIKDLKNGYDIVFNYGTFDFNTPNFYVKFALGGLDYMLSVESFENFMMALQMENRSVTEQILDFNKEQRLRAASLLIANYRPENRFYRYKFFTDNCSTRIRDVIADAAKDSMMLLKPGIDSEISFHTLYTSYLKTMPWSKFGISFLLGTLTTKKAGYNALFLPDNLKKAIDKARLDGHTLVKSEKVILESVPQNPSSAWFSPFILTLILLVSALVIQLKSKWTLWYDRIFFLIFGLLSLFILCLCVFSHHAELHWNLVLLFLLPTNIIIPFLKNKDFKKYYCIFALTIIVLGYFSLPVLPQKFNLPFLLLTLSLALRLFFNFAPIKAFKNIN
jgi:hypothetical protein